MKKKKIIVFFTIFVSIYVLINITDVLAGNNASGGGKGDSTPCADGAKCYSGTSGVRATFVTYKDGKVQRCKYNSSTKKNVF